MKKKKIIIINVNYVINNYQIIYIIDVQHVFTFKFV